MDNYLSTEFGNLGLSSSAREWRPSGAQQQQQQQQQARSYTQQPPPPPEQRRQQQPPVQSKSIEWNHQHGETELSYSVKEFIPGHGWSTQGSSGLNTMNDGKHCL